MVSLCGWVLVLPEGLEPPTTGSKPVVISISPRERLENLINISILA